MRGENSMFLKPKEKPPEPKLVITKEKAKQLNDELDLDLERDRGIHQRFAEQLQRFESNPDLSFLRDNVEDQNLFVEKEFKEAGEPKKFITFRAQSPYQDPDLYPTPCPEPAFLEDDDDDEEELQHPNQLSQDNQANQMAKEILFEIKQNTELLLTFSARQRDIQDKLANAYNQRDHDGIENPKIEQFTRELSDLIIPLQTLTVALSGLKIDLKMVKENDIKRTLVAEPNREINNNNNNNNNVVEQVSPTYKRK
jgi:hypothetical protein